MTAPKLLLADDSATIRKVVELTFVDEGIDVFAVADGNAAMLKFVEVQPDIVLVDVEMPGPSGYQICEMIKQDEATKHLPVLLLVGSFEPFDQDAAERVGADGFLTKPFHSIRELVARVRDLLGPGEPEMAAGPEIDDIEDLYTSSFADTLPIHDYETEEDLFHDVRLEAVELQHEQAEAEIFVIPESPFSEPGSEKEEVDAASTEASAELNQPGPDTFENRGGELPPVPVFGADRNEVDLFEDAGLDDEMIETVRVSGAADDVVDALAPVDEDVREEPELIAAPEAFADPVSELIPEPELELGPEPEILERISGSVPRVEQELAPEIEFSDDANERAEPEPEFVPEPEHAFEPEPEPVLVKDFDWSLAAKIVDELPPEPEELAFEPRFVFADGETDEVSRFSHEIRDPLVKTGVTVEEPTQELVELIAKRVIEKLSDHVIREIAQEAVPRIAEKLIREALEEENKT